MANEVPTPQLGSPRSVEPREDQSSRTRATDPSEARTEPSAIQEARRLSTAPRRLKRVEERDELANPPRPRDPRPTEELYDLGKASSTHSS